ncbi:MAG TPA: type II toxin-antitoxin system death-on-curing family toxin [Thermoanaerobaculia bacterium]
MTHYLSVAQIEALHAIQIERYGGASGIRDRGGMEAAAARPAMTFGGDDLYPDIPSKAAALLHSLVMNHPFLDGNKRVGAHALLAFLGANDMAPLFGARELEETVMAVARGEMDIEPLTIWLRQRIARRD